MPQVRLSPLLYAAGLAAQRLMPLRCRPPAVPEPSLPIAAPTEILVPTRHGDVRCLVFRPHPDAPLAHPVPPVHLQIHGGGFVLRGVHDDDHICRFLASDVGCVVVSIDYDVAPQVTFPVAEQQCFDVLRWVIDNAEDRRWDASRLTAGGGSAGGKLATNVAQQAHAASIPLRGAVLSYAAADLTRSDRRSPSTRFPAISPLVQKAVLALYFPDRVRRFSPLASPILDVDLPGKMPATLIQTGDDDTLGPEMATIARRLDAAGATVRHTGYPSDHGFTATGDPELVDRSVREIGEFLSDALR